MSDSKPRLKTRYKEEILRSYVKNLVTKTSIKLVVLQRSLYMGRW